MLVGILVDMGIRYFAVSIDLDDYEHLRVGTCKTCGEEPRLRQLEEHRPSLDLDKSWGFLQLLLHSEPPRPAAALVAGQVTDTSWGWRSYRGVLGAEEVKAIAADLATVSTELLHQRLVVEGPHGSGPDERSQQDLDYVSQYLDDARKFTRDAAADGRGIVYYIG